MTMMGMGRLPAGESMPDIDPAELAAWSEDDLAELNGLMDRLVELTGIRPDALPWPTSDPDHLLRLIAPNYATAQLAAHHLTFWRWVYGIAPGKRPQPFVGIWGRGQAKTSSVQLAVSALGATRRRRYCLYVTRTQLQGDKKVEDLAAIFTDPHFAARYPEMAQTKTLLINAGTNRAQRRSAEWSRKRIRTGNGFTIEAIGLDVAARGIKVEDQRPDVIVFDDIDDQDDNPGKVQRHLNAIRRSIIPAGSVDVAIIYINNLVHDNSIASRLAFPELFHERERLLLNRIVSGPIPAVFDMEVKYQGDAGDGEPGYVITAGRPAWPGYFGLDMAQDALNATNLQDFGREYQHDTEERNGIFDHIDFDGMLANLEDVPWGKMITVEVWVDPATSDTHRSDSMGVSCAGVDTDGIIWIFYSWEQITTPTDALKKAITVGYLYGASVLGVETDNGGDAWKPVFREALRELKEDAAGKNEDKEVRSFNGVFIPEDWEIEYDSARAGQTNKSKEERIKMLITPLERQRMRFVRGTHDVIRRALLRFPKKPLDGVDAFWWNWTKLVEAALKKKTKRSNKAKAIRPQWRPQPRL